MDLTLPLLGDVMTEGTVARWLQPDGAIVEAGSPLYEVETDKVTMTVDSPVDGRVQWLVTEGDTVPVGAVVARLDEVGAPAVARAAEGHTAAERVDVRATPAARAAARRLGVDLRQIANGRRIREADVLNHVPASAKVAGVALSGRRKLIAERMRSSLLRTAQVTESMEVDMVDALRLREQFRALVVEERIPGVTDLVIRAVVLALREHPVFNATFADERLRVHAEVHMGVAVDTEDGLLVPVVRDVNGMDLLTLAWRTREAVDRARTNNVMPEDVNGGTFTVTSLGALGVDFFTPIINPPQVAILGIGRITERKTMYLSLSFDHQVVDGAPAARFLQSIKRYLELPVALVAQIDR
ncbi:MAG: 2-oxo acid dehydrogenase subunit E2 [Chloroflexi bacterium]|nr:2-oxo acid dehydrogenase subunit E2 [Chloroflexota bacterium]MBV9131273.1 2-oxo acid dehydrogenase subunit E2 [Chloroflexota bacterium]MBV9898313.1 2-oxo acid dehydrogenase subunit E2 [Chloroflexota bacterium]